MPKRNDDGSDKPNCGSVIEITAPADRDRQILDYRMQVTQFRDMPENFQAQ